VRKLRKDGKTVPEIMRLTELSKASIYRALPLRDQAHSWILWGPICIFDPRRVFT
jgi:hypothetical protein